MKRTQWYLGTIKPVRVGVYECEWEYLGTISYFFNFWDSEGWRFGYPLLDQRRVFVKASPIDDEHTLIKWRGVKK